MVAVWPCDPCRGRRSLAKETAATQVAAIFRPTHGSVRQSKATDRFLARFLTDLHSCVKFWARKRDSGRAPMSLAGGGDRRVKLQFDPRSFEEDANQPLDFRNIQFSPPSFKSCVSNPEVLKTCSLNLEVSKTFKNSFI